MINLFTTNEAAKYLGLTEATVRSLCWNGKLSARKHGPNWIIPGTAPRTFELSELKDHQVAADAPSRGGES